MVKLVAIKDFDSPQYGPIIKGQPFAATEADAAAFLRDLRAKKAPKED